MDKYRILVAISIVALIFDNIPKALQLTTISGGAAGKFTWYPLVILLLLKIQEYYRQRSSLEKKEIYMLRYIFFFTCIILVSNIQGLLVYPYYDELLAGPLSQIEKLPHVLQFFQNHGISVSVQSVFMSWIGVRAVKGTIFNIIYTFGFAFILYSVIKNSYPDYLRILKKCVFISVSIISAYSCIELLYLAGNSVATSVLSFINPMLHPIAVDHGWWPPLLWKNQLRSVFSEPSRMGNYAAFALPFLWMYVLKAKTIFTPKIVLIFFYTFLIFMTKARTPVAMYWGLLVLFVIFTLVFTHRTYVKRLGAILLITALSLLLSVGFIKVFMQQNNQVVTVESYLSDNVSSLTKDNARSNGARYALIRSNLKTGMEHPFFGTGDYLTSSYTVHNFNEYDLRNGEVQLWVHSFNEQGVLKYGLGAMNEYVSQFAQHGIVGLLVFIFPFFFIVLKLFKKIRVTTGTEQLDTIAVTLSLIGSAVAGCNGSLSLLYAYWVILAYAYAEIYQETEGIKRLDIK